MKKKILLTALLLATITQASASFSDLFTSCCCLRSARYTPLVEPAETPAPINTQTDQQELKDSRILHYKIFELLETVQELEEKLVIVQAQLKNTPINLELSTKKQSLQREIVDCKKDLTSCVTASDPTILNKPFWSAFQAPDKPAIRHQERFIDLAALGSLTPWATYLLITHGADINAKDNDGNTFLHRIASDTIKTRDCTCARNAQRLNTQYMIIAFLLKDKKAQQRPLIEHPTDICHCPAQLFVEM